MEMFTRRLQAAAQSRCFSYHPRCKQIRLSSLCFADDLLIFCKPTISSMRVIGRVIDRFGTESGLKVNGAKSKLFFGGVAQDHKLRCAALLGFEIGQMPVRYLGAPLHCKRLKPGDYAPLLSKLQSAIDGRQTCFLSYPGRVQVIKTVLESIIGFWMQVLQFPKSILRRIESICRSYLWSGTTGKKRTLVAWKIACRGFECGGLGFKELLSWNKTLLFKLALDLDSDRPCIWKSWAARNLLKGVSIWSCGCASNSSVLWKSVLTARDDVRRCFAGQQFPVERLLKPSGKLNSAVTYSYLAKTFDVVPWCDILWKGIHPRKWAFTCWLATRDRLPTKERLQRWGLVNSANCPLCSTSSVESAAHLWFNCSVVQRILDIVFDWQGVHVRKDCLHEWWAWFIDSPNRRNNIYLAKLMAFTGVVYYCWKLRNDVIFNGVAVDVDRVGKDIINACKFRLIYKIKTNTRRGRAMMRRLIER